MNQLTTLHPALGFGRRLAPASETPVSAQDALQARFALRVTSALTQRTAEIDADLGERLRFAREKALASVKRPAGNAPVDTQRSGASAMWLRIAAVLPAIALIAGLMLIQRWQDNAQITTAADIDAALLSDDLPPTAYSDAGFAEFLKSTGE